MVPLVLNHGHLYPGEGDCDEQYFRLRLGTAAAAERAGTRRFESAPGSTGNKSVAKEAKANQSVGILEVCRKLIPPSTWILGHVSESEGSPV